MYIRKLRTYIRKFRIYIRNLRFNFAYGPKQLFAACSQVLCAEVVIFCPIFVKRTF